MHLGKIKRSLQLHSENGSALLLVMFLVLLLSVLGMAVMGAAIGGATRTETRESDIQSLHLAQKGLNEATAYVASQLPENINPDQLAGILGELTLPNDTDHMISTNLGTLGNDAEGIITSITGTPDVLNSRIYYIDVTATAEVNGVNRNLRQRITLDSYPDFLKYAFGSEHNLILNGAPHLQGNVYAGNQLIIRNIANYTYNGFDNQKQTSYPQISANSVSAGEVHVQSWDSIRHGISQTPLAKEAGNLNDTLKEILDITPDRVKIKEKKKFVEINVTQSFGDKLEEAGVLSPEDMAKARAFIQNKNISGLNGLLIGAHPTEGHLETPVLLRRDYPEGDQDHDLIKEIDDYNETELRIYNSKLAMLSTLYDSMIFDKDLTVDKIGYKSLEYASEDIKNGDAANPPKWLIVAGDLNLANNSADFLNVRGNILVTGDVTIKGKVAFNSTMLVLGKTTIEDAEIERMDGKELVLISSGRVLVNRFDAFKEVSTAEGTSASEMKMKGFFYTEANGILYGVGSKFWLEGGFFAKGDLEVNAVTGSVNASLVSELDIAEDAKRRRFFVDYNNKVYEDQKASLPRVTNVSVSVGPVELLK